MMDNIRQQLADTAAQLQELGGVDCVISRWGMTREELRETIKDYPVVPSPGPVQETELQLLLVIGIMIGKKSAGGVV